MTRVRRSISNIPSVVIPLTGLTLADLGWYARSGAILVWSPMIGTPFTSRPPHRRRRVGGTALANTPIGELATGAPEPEAGAEPDADWLRNEVKRKLRNRKRRAARARARSAKE